MIVIDKSNRMYIIELTVGHELKAEPNAKRKAEIAKIAIFVVVKLACFSLELETGCATTVARSDGARDQIRLTGNRPLL